MSEKLINQPLLFAVGMNHKTSPVEVREKIYVSEDEIPAFLSKLRETLSESIVLSTCNRTEIYGVCDSGEVDLNFYKDLLIDFKNVGDTVKREHFFSFVSCAACQQLFNVSASIDSKIIGDDQILQQIRNAYSLANQHNSTGKILNQLAQRAFKVGKKTYTETAIHKGAVSTSLAAVELAIETIGSLKDKSVMIVGAGDTARLTAECLIKREVGKIFITNRTESKATELLSDLQKFNKFDGEIVNFSDFSSFLNKTDIVISSTSSAEYILHEKDFAQQSNKILLIDIAVPRDIDPSSANNKNVVLKNIDDLHSVVDRNFVKRMSEMPDVKRFIAKEMGEFLFWYYSLPLLPEFTSGKGKPEPATIEEIKQVKDFLAKNVSLFHKLARQSNGTAEEDLKSHINLVKQLYELKNAPEKEFAVER